MSDTWLFDQPENCGVISLRQIVHKGAPILLVTHDEDDHGWQFLDGSDEPNISDAVIVCLSHMVDSDPTLLELADLPPGLESLARISKFIMDTRRKSAGGGKLIFNMPLDAHTTCWAAPR
jgi:hypothetical protein